jgi:hypothetical protein
MIKRLLFTRKELPLPHNFSRFWSCRLFNIAHKVGLKKSLNPRLCAQDFYFSMQPVFQFPAGLATAGGIQLVRTLMDFVFNLRWASVNNGANASRRTCRECSACFPVFIVCHLEAPCPVQLDESSCAFGVLGVRLEFGWFAA